MILDRDVPIARLVPVKGMGRQDADSMLAELERRGIIRKGQRRPDAKLTARLGPPPKARGDIIEALLADREESR